jgi:hypothetical protein
LLSKEDKAEVIFDYFDAIMGAPAEWVNGINLAALDLPQLELLDLCNRFTEDEVWCMIRDMPPDKAPGPDGFTTHFLQCAWHIIQYDLMCVFDTFWS